MNWSASSVSGVGQPVGLLVEDAREQVEVERSGR